MEQKETARLAPHAGVTLMNYLEAANKAQCKKKTSITIDQAGGGVKVRRWAGQI